jgi:hypothetical protein
MAALPYAMAAVQAVQALAEEVEFLHKENIRLKQENAILKQDHKMIQKPGKVDKPNISIEYKKNVISKPVKGEQSKTPAPHSREVEDIFRAAFEESKKEKGWVTLGEFGNVLSRRFPSFKYKKLSQLVGNYPQLIEQKQHERYRAIVLIRLKRPILERAVPSARPARNSKAIQTLSSSTVYDPRYGYGHGEIMRGDERTDNRSKKDTLQGIYDPRYGDKHLGTQVREPDGRYGTLPLSDDYSEESRP